MIEQFFIKNLWRDLVGLPEEEWSINITNIEQTEWSPRFEQLMRNRLVTGGMRYGRVNDPNKPPWDRVDALLKNILMYRLTKNKEYLVDIANYCLLEFEEGVGVWNSSDDTEHCKI
jgi:hypothetical protein